jgi:hypothetical protein
LNSELDSLARSYARLSGDVGGRINFACDLDNEDALRVAEQEKAHLDQGFFVLTFGALERHITSLACARFAEEARRTAMRDADISKRWDAAAKVAREILGTDVAWDAHKGEVLSWYKIRSDIAHGRLQSAQVDLPAIIYRADDIATTSDQVLAVI